MPIVKFPDGGGSTMTLLDIDGHYYPAVASEEQMRSIRNLKARDDDVLLICFNKSGTHWLWEIISMLNNGSAETINTIKQMSMLEVLSLEQAEALPSPRVLNTHFKFERLPADLVAQRTKIVLIHRNPKDVAVSMYYHHTLLTGVYDYHGKWSDYLTGLFLPGNTDCGSWCEYVLYWERVMRENPDYPIHLMFYEDLKEDSAREIKKLVKFLGLDTPDELCAAIGDKCQFANMQQDKQGLETGVWRTMWKDSTPSYYRKGEVGDWKNYFSVAQNELFDKWLQENMTDSKLTFRYQL